MPCHDSREAEDNRRCKERLDRATRLLCQVMREGRPVRISMELRDWWAEHRLDDAERLAREHGVAPRTIGRVAAEIAHKQAKEIGRNREALIEAWVAQHGWRPDECHMVTQQMQDGTTRIWIERMDDQKFGPLNAWRALKQAVKDNDDGTKASTTEGLLGDMAMLEKEHGVKL